MPDEGDLVDTAFPLNVRTIQPSSDEVSPHLRVKKPEQMMNGLLYIREHFEPMILSMDSEIAELVAKTEQLKSLKAKYERVVEAAAD